MEFQKPSGKVVDKEVRSPYAGLAHLFIELRGRGLSLSASDIDFIAAWEMEQIDPEFIAKTMLNIADECREKAVSFPASLKSINTRLHRALRNSAEF